MPRSAFESIWAVVAGVLAVTLAACGGGSPEGTKEAASAPPRAEYVESDAAREAKKLIDADKPHEAVALLKKHLAENPKDASGHFELARAYDRIAFHINLYEKGTEAERQAALEQAADHYWRFISLVKDLGLFEASFALVQLVEIYSPGGLKRPADAKNVAERLIALAPQKALPYTHLARVLRDGGQLSEATALLRKLRFELAVSEQGDLAHMLWRHVEDSPKLPRPDVEAIVNDLRMIADGSLATRPKDPTGPEAMQRALELEANRLESNPKRRQELLAEAKRWQEITLAAERGEMAQMEEKLKALQKRMAEMRK